MFVDPGDQLSFGFTHVGVSRFSRIITFVNDGILQEQRSK